MKDKVEAAEVALPPLFTTLADSPGTQWIIFKVEEALDWRNVLSGSRLRLNGGSDAHPELVKTSLPLRARLVKDSWKQFLPLKPQTPSSKRLVAVGGGVRMVVNIVPATKDMDEADRASNEAKASRAAAEKRIQAGAAGQRALLEEQRKKNMKRFKVSTLVETLRKVGFVLSAEDDFTRRGEEDAGDGETLHLKPMSPEEAGEGKAIVAFWGVGPLRDGGARELSVKCYPAPKRGQGLNLRARMANATAQEFVASRLRRRTNGPRYLLGVQAAESKRIFIHEAELYHFSLKRKEVPTDDMKTEEQLSYGQRRGQLIADHGTVKKQRAAKLKMARASREHKVVDFGAASDAAHRAEELRAKVVAVAKQDQELKAKLLPAWDPEATKPKDVYKEGLRRMAPPELVVCEEKTLVDPELADFLQRDPAAQAESVAALERLPESCKPADLKPFRTRVALAVAAARVRGGVRAKDGDAALRLARSFGVLNCLVQLVSMGPRFRGGKCMPQGVAELCGLAQTSALAALWHAEYYDEMLGRRKVRSFNGRRALCAMLCWALQLTPAMSIEFPPSVERELRLLPGQVKKALEYLGCSVAEDRLEKGAAAPAAAASKKISASLIGPPRMNINHYEKQRRKNKDKHK